MRRYIIIAIIWTLLCIGAFLPARWAGALLPASLKPQIIAGSLSGTLWDGQVKLLPPKTRWPLHIHYKINPLSALFRAPYSHMQLSGSGFSSKGKLGIFGQNHIQAKDISAEFNMALLPISDPRLTELSGQSFITLDRLKIKNGCRVAEGRARTNILSVNLDNWQWSGPLLSGPISCDGDIILAAMRGQDDNHDISFDLRLFPDGVYGIDIQITPKTALPADFAIALGLLGFEQTEDGVAILKEKGQIFQGERR